MSNDNPAIKPVDNFFASIMSMMLPGLGQLMKGQIMPGIFWALAVGCGYFMYFWPGLIIHGFCILDAAITRGEGHEGKPKTLANKLLLIGMVVSLLIYIVIRNF